MYIFLYNESKQLLKIDFRNTYFEDSEQSTEFRGAFSIQFNAKKYFASLLTNYTPFLPYKFSIISLDSIFTDLTFF